MIGHSQLLQKQVAATMSLQKKVQLTIQSVWNINDHKSQEIHYLIGEMIAVDI